jgi:3-isopropylmalate/(R)-2-methylmalate dehydratase large subunit
MGMTITEKIIAAHAGKDRVAPGELVSVKVDVALANDITAPGAILEFNKVGVGSVFDRDKVIVVPDHFTPNKDVKSAEQAKMVREFAHAQGLINYFEIGQMGVEHALLPELGLVLPGELVIGADSHTCTYGGMGAFSTGMGSTDLAAAWATGETWLKVPPSLKFNVEGELGQWVSGKDIILYIIGKIGVDGALYKAMEFTGGTFRALSMDSRFSVCNMAIEAGGKNGIIAVDDITRAYVAERSDREYTVYESDADAAYEQVFEFEAADIELQVAFPHLPSNTRGISKVGDVPVDQVVIGSCTNGRIEDMRIAAQILKGKKIDPRIRLIVIPATQGVYKQAMHEGLFDIFIDAGGAISTPTCGPCLGGHMGVLASGERALATTNRNFVGRMGHKDSEVYLAGPAVAAATAIAGKIAGPEDL